jgi:7-carboxy-7-deazaguanine synthase
VYLKFVVETVDHVNEAVKAVDAFRAGGFKGSVYLMPVGGTTPVYDKNEFNVAKIAMDRGYYYSPRLHLSLFGNSWGT